MEVHWHAKWLSIPYNGATTLLQGVSSVTDTELVIQLLAIDMSDTTTPQMQLPDSEPSTMTLPDEIVALLAEFPTVFQVPSSLPPKRACGHAIPLISGATPVNIRAYQYPPSLKDEIERQVNTMLDQGLI